MNEYSHRHTQASEVIDHRSPGIYYSFHFCPSVDSINRLMIDETIGYLVFGHIAKYTAASHILCEAPLTISAAARMRILSNICCNFRPILANLSAPLHYECAAPNVSERKCGRLINQNLSENWIRRRSVKLWSTVDNKLAMTEKCNRKYYLGRR